MIFTQPWSMKPWIKQMPLGVLLSVITFYVYFNLYSGFHVCSPQFLFYEASRYVMENFLAKINTNEWL